MRFVTLPALLLILTAIAPMSEAMEAGPYESDLRAFDLGSDLTDVAIWNDTVAYCDGTGNVYAFDIRTNKSLLLDTMSDTPRIYCQFVCWAKGPSNTLIVYDLARSEYRNTLVNNVTGISISGDRVVISRFEHDPYSNGSISNIYVFNIDNDTIESVSLFPSNKMNPCIYGDMVVWQDTRSGDKDIYMFNLTTRIERAITDEPGDQVFPRAWGDWVVYRDQRTTPSRAIAYSLSSRERIIISTNGGGFPMIYGDHVVFTISGTYVFDISCNQSYKISEKNVAKGIWENRIVDIDSGRLLLLEFKKKGPDNAGILDILPFIIIAVLITGGAGTCGVMLWYDEGGSKKKDGGD